MTIDDRAEVVSVVQETYVLVGRVLATDIAVLPWRRQDVVSQLQGTDVEYVVTDAEMLGLLQNAYLALAARVSQLESELLGPSGDTHDLSLAAAGLTGSERAVKVRGFRRALERLLSAVPGTRRRWAKKALEWANIILGSLRGVPVVGVIADPLKELKEAVETQADEDQAEPT